MNQALIDFMTEVALDDEELAEDYSNHAFYCGFHIVGLCTNPEGQCTEMQEARDGAA